MDIVYFAFFGKMMLLLKATDQFPFSKKDVYGPYPTIRTTLFQRIMQRHYAK